jgi:chorismate dehydratase
MAEFSNIRIGAVGYLNSKPLIEGLNELAPGVEIVLDAPSRLAEDLSSGLLDVALVPSIELLQHPEYEVVSDACVATHGAVLSVKLYCRVPPGDVRTLALDEGSRTSAALAQILLAERFGAEPDVELLPLGRTTAATRADAVLLIGDRAIPPATETFVETWDLGEQWLDWTGLPFVFALWAARTGECPDGLAEALSAARDLGVRHVAQIAAREAPLVGIPETVAVDYLTKNLAFHLGSAERNGLKLFHRLAAERGFAHRGSDLGLRSHQPARQSR